MLAGGAIELAKEFRRLRFPAWTGHMPTFNEVFKDHPEVEVVPVRDEHEMFACQRNMILTGIYKRPFDYWKGGMEEQWRRAESFDHRIYREIGIPLEKKWDSFPWRPNVEPVYIKPFIFVHDDASRGFVIETNRIPDWTQDQMCCPGNDISQSITKWAELILSAHEIHCINSSFLWFCDLLPLPTQQRKFCHRYARPWNVCDIPTFRHQWTILD
jgi:hypothetical protein